MAKAAKSFSFRGWGSGNPFYKIIKPSVPAPRLGDGKTHAKRALDQRQNIDNSIEECSCESTSGDTTIDSTVDETADTVTETANESSGALQLLGPAIVGSLSEVLSVAVESRTYNERQFKILRQNQDRQAQLFEMLLQNQETMRRNQEQRDLHLERLLQAMSAEMAVGSSTNQAIILLLSGNAKSTGLSPVLRSSSSEAEDMANQSQIPLSQLPPLSQIQPLASQTQDVVQPMVNKPGTQMNPIDLDTEKLDGNLQLIKQDPA